MKIFAIGQFLNILRSGYTLSEVQARALQEAILEGKLNTADLLAVFQVLENRPLTEPELEGFLQASLAAMTALEPVPSALDTCGTGGDGSGSFNISTAAAIVCAAAGASVAKHGNRAASSRCGSADVLGALGIKIDMPPRRAREVLDKCGFVFLFAQVFHPAFKHAAEARKIYGKKTYFNLLGPLLNPARASFRLHGLADFTLAEIVGRALLQTGVKKVWLVRGQDGLDEISPFAPTQVMQFAQGQSVKQFILDPAAYGLAQKDRQSLKGADAETNGKIIEQVLQGRGTPAQNAAVVLNAAGGLTVSGLAENFEQGIKLATWAITSGRARAKLEEIIDISNSI